ncbi:MAG: FxsA family protein [Actinomycetota bacterium]|nr:FxsA family protein [Actinomycetota bacterium]
MPLLLIAVFIIVPLVELYVIIKVGGSIGIGPTILLLLVDSILGSLLLRSQGRSAWVALNRALAESRIPAKEVLDGVLIIFGGALLLTPGFITDVFGLLLLIPPTRAIVRGVLNRFVVGRFTAAPRAAMWGYGQVQGRRGRRDAPRDPRAAPAAEREPRRGEPVAEDFDWTSRAPGGQPADIEGTAHEVRDDDTLPPGEGRGSFPG